MSRWTNPAVSLLAVAVAVAGCGMPSSTPSAANHRTPSQPGAETTPAPEPVDAPVQPADPGAGDGTFAEHLPVNNPLTWPLVDGLHDPNLIVYDKAYLEGYLTVFADRATICGLGPTCELVSRDARTQFASDIDCGDIGNRFHIDHLRRFLRSRIDGGKKVYTDSRLGKMMTPYERDVWCCVKLTGDAGARQAVPELIRLLADPRREIRVATVWALHQLSDDASDAIDALSAVLETDLAPEAAQALAAVGEAAIPTLTRKARSGGVDARIYSIEALGLIGPPARSAVDTLIEALYENRDVTDRSGYISSYAATALGAIRDTRALPHLRKMASAQNTDVLEASRRAIKNIEDPLPTYNMPGAARN